MEERGANLEHAAVAAFRDPLPDALPAWVERKLRGAADEEILRRTESVLGQGAAGIVYGRNVIQHADPAGMTRALMAIVHEGATTEEALEGLATRA